ncbi:DUF2301 domain-containing membrane protein [[Haemophilus] ducreyi]|uniref:DUF2301 domain-containing membrane protein n=1 Tax=Haemophilus ducreyi TaxID=730 RepID=UPI000655A310|nr:DUF2301 domain-containing membrane protein [[Haemophilus] ducreyi]AKO44962.1 membrane protein [[Haemophilus] ducreyi]AKO46364.1 membrane protein [[Haemophilus] ducreyi]AKO47710.1 membrane protein [[Haemophilus] ducreyi]AKO49092.1 membrane protein [[Haemophilus] ducreyi]ANF62152.1 hypothetical protein A6037_05215 [[Haemophilus] ducreyi]
MSDPHITSPMDFWDYLTVITYRLGFVLASIALLLFPYYIELAYSGLLIAGTMLASSLHLYMKNIRLVFQFSVWIGLLCQVFGLPTLALGAILLVIGGLSYKEYFCFRIWGLNFQPLLMALLWLAECLSQSMLINLSSLASGILLILLSIQKWRMPLHFDIGDKTKYQI